MENSWTDLDTSLRDLVVLTWGGTRHEGRRLIDVKFDEMLQIDRKLDEGLSAKNFNEDMSRLSVALRRVVRYFIVALPCQNQHVRLTPPPRPRNCDTLESWAKNVDCWLQRCHVTDKSLRHDFLRSIGYAVNKIDERGFEQFIHGIIDEAERTNLLLYLHEPERN